MPIEVHQELQPSAADLRYIDDLITQYVAEMNDPAVTWGRVDPLQPVQNVDELKTLAHRFATRLTQRQQRVQTHFSDQALQELVHYLTNITCHT